MKKVLFITSFAFLSLAMNSKAVDTIEQAINKGQPNVLRQLFSHDLVLQKASKDRYLEQAQVHVAKAQAKLENKFNIKDLLRIATGASSLVLSAGSLAIGSYCFFGDKPEDAQKTVVYGTGTITASAGVVLAALGLRQIQKGLTKYDENINLDRAVAVKSIIEQVPSV